MLQSNGMIDRLLITYALLIQLTATNCSRLAVTFQTQSMQNRRTDQGLDTALPKGMRVMAGQKPE